MKISKLSESHDFYVALGRRLTELRQGYKMSQEQLGDILGVKYQQIHKYETGENRMPPERIMSCARYFKIPVGYFYGEIEEHRTFFEKDVIAIATEIMSLPEDMRERFFYITKHINKSSNSIPYSKSLDKA